MCHVTRKLKGGSVEGRRDGLMAGELGPGCHAKHVTRVVLCPVAPPLAKQKHDAQLQHGGCVQVLVDFLCLMHGRKLGEASKVQSEVEALDTDIALVRPW